MWPSSTPSTRAALLIPSAVGLMLALLTLPAQGLVLDDWVHLLLVQQGSLDVFRFAEGDPALNQAAQNAGALPWFATPDLKVTFLRPLAAALQHADYALFGHGVVGRGLHSAAWYAGLCAVVAALYRKVLPGDLALPAALLFAVGGGHAQTVAWFAARNVLVSATFGGLALLAHLSWREGWRLGSVAAPVCLALALMGGEAGLGAFAYLIAFELIGARGALSRRLLHLLPALAVTFVWATAWLLLDTGVSGSGAYVDPIAEPLAWLGHAPARLIFSMGVLLTGLSADTWYLYPRWHGGLAVLGGVAAVPVLAWLAPTLRHLPEERRAPVLWLSAGALLALLPQLSGLLGSRSFVLPGLGAMVVVTTLVRDGLRSEGKARGVRRLGAGVLLSGHLVFGLALWALIPMGLQTTRTPTARALADLARLQIPSTTTVLWLGPPGPDLATHATSRLRTLDQPVPRMLPLTLSPRHLRIHRRAPHVWDVTLLDGTWLDGAFAPLYRRPGTLHAGQGRQLDHLNAHVLEDLHGSPTRVRFTAEGEVVLLTWEGGSVRIVELAVDETTELGP